MFSSQRKANHNLVFEEGLTNVILDAHEDYKICMGTRKPSVGVSSQIMMFERYPEYTCIVHTHNPLTEEGEKVLPVRQQAPYQCGSMECGQNTVEGLEYISEGVLGVYLEKHGPVFMFRSDVISQVVIDILNKYVKLGVKVK